MNTLRSSLFALIACTISGCFGGYTVGISGGIQNTIKPGESTYLQVEVTFEDQWAGKEAELIVDLPAELIAEPAKSKIVLNAKGKGETKFKITAKDHATAGSKKIKVMAEVAKNVGTFMDFAVEVKEENK